MSSARRELTADDELLLDAIGRRLGAIDDELPRLRSWRADRVAAGQLHVVRGRTRRARSGERGIEAGNGGRRPHPRVRVDVAAAAMAAVLAVAVLAANRGAEVGRPAGIAAATPPGPAFSFGAGPSAAATSAPTPVPSGPAPTAIGTRPSADPGRGEAPDAVEPAGVQAVLGRMGWRCGVLVQVALDPLGAGLLEKLAAAAADGGGYLPAAFGPGWIGSDPRQAARVFKGRPLLTDALGSLWILRGEGPDAEVLQLVPERSASGVSIWRSADVLWSAACVPGTDPKNLVVRRSPTDWPTGRIVDLTVVRLAPPATLAGRRS